MWDIVRERQIKRQDPFFFSSFFAPCANAKEEEERKEDQEGREMEGTGLGGWREGGANAEPSQWLATGERG